MDLTDLNNLYPEKMIMFAVYIIYYSKENTSIIHDVLNFYIFSLSLSLKK